MIILANSGLNVPFIQLNVPFLQLNVPFLQFKCAFFTEEKVDISTVMIHLTQRHIYEMKMENQILKSKTPKVYKHKFLNTASYGGFHHSDYQIFLDLISKIGGVDKKGRYLQPEQMQREHVLTDKEHAKKFNLNVDNSYRYLKKSCDKLMEKILRIDSLDGKKIIKINVCSSAEYDQKEGKITIRFIIKLLIKSYQFLFEPYPYTPKVLLNRYLIIFVLTIILIDGFKFSPIRIGKDAFTNSKDWVIETLSPEKLDRK